MTICGWSDGYAYTVVAVSASGKKVTLRRDTATLLNGANSGEPDALVMTPGGFAGHTTGVQRYEYAPDQDGAVRVARWSAKHGAFRSAGERVKFGRFEHYDFNF